MRKCYAVLLLCLSAILFAGCTATPESYVELEKIDAIEGFEVPECTLYDGETGFVYVSNVEAEAGEFWTENGKGFISRLHPDGTIDEIRWIDSSEEFVINGPKGMSILDGELFAADISRVLVFSLEDEEPLRYISVEGAEELNDMTTDGENVYVSDTSVGHILRLDLTGEENHEVIAELEGVNGIVFHEGQMFAVSWDLHEVYEIDLDGIEPPQSFGLEEHFTALDGIDILDDGTFVVSDFPGNSLFAISQDRTTVRTLDELTSPAEFGINRDEGLLYVPQFHEDRVVIYELH